MHTFDRRQSFSMVILFVAIAVLGYVLGHDRAPVVATAKNYTISATSSVLLSYPTGWQPAASAPDIPGLSIDHPVVLGPDGNSAHAGLLSGGLPAGGPGPLPARFLALVKGIPHTEVVDLLDGQAYRYSQLHIPGYDRTLDLYVIPNSGESPTVLACYASKESSSYLPQCEQIVAMLTLIGQSSAYDLTPDMAYAHQLGRSIEALNRERLILRREMRLHATPAAIGRLAASLADQFDAAAAHLTVLEPPPAVGLAQAALADSILRARDAYTALAATVVGGSLSRSAAARGQVYQAERSVNTALESFALLGYRT